MWIHMENPTEIELGLNASSLPRLQVTGERIEGDPRNQMWHYHLVYKHFTEGFVKVLLQQQTRESAGSEDLFDDEGNIEPTIRISADSKWDAVQMNLPLYYIADGKVEKVNLNKFKEKFKDKIENELK